MGVYLFVMGLVDMFFSLHLIFLILRSAIVYLIIKQCTKQNKIRNVEGKSALDFAKERYAKDKIIREEFEEIKKTLI